MIGMSRMPVRQLMVMLVGLALTVAIGVGVWVWSSTPDYRVLYSNLSDRDGGSVIAALAQISVPYRIAEGGGAILVPATLVHDTRLKLASQGLPRNSTVGFELVDNQKFGATQFQEQITYQRALEGELTRSIQTLSAVASARVHLAIPKPSVFVREHQMPTASVLVTLHPGRELERAQVAGIVQLVASSVPQLALENVSVIDQNGNVLSQRRDAADGGLDPAQLSYVKQLEQASIDRITSILEPVVGHGNVRVQVTADIDFTRTEAVAETFRPNQDPKESALRSQQTSESSSSANAVPTGIPGALSNQPPAGGTTSLDARSTAVNAPAPGTPVNVKKDAIVAYEVDKKIEHTKATVGALRRMTAAVVVNYRKQTDASGKTTAVPIPAPELEQLTVLVRDAMGFSKERGDSLNVVNAAFNEPQKEAVPDVPVWKQPENVQMAKDAGRYLVFAVVIAYLVFGVLKPMWRQAAAASLAPPPDSAASLPAPLPRGEALQRARQLAREDPKVVASVVKNWVSQ